MTQKRVLIADDCRVAYAALEGQLTEHGVECRHAIHGKQALTMLGIEHFDLVVLDWHMPVMGGPATLLEIRKRWPGLQVFLCTAADDPVHTGEETLDWDGVLEKPIRPLDIDIIMLQLGAP